MGAFTLAEIDATLAHLKAEYGRQNHLKEYGVAGPQERHREVEKIRCDVEHWERRRDRRVHECAFGVHALESEPVDPRL